MIPPNKDNEPRLDYQSAYLLCPVCNDFIETKKNYDQICNHCKLYHEFYLNTDGPNPDNGSFNVRVGTETFCFDGNEPNELAEQVYSAIERVKREYLK